MGNKDIVTHHFIQTINLIIVGNTTAVYTDIFSVLNEQNFKIQ